MSDALNYMIGLMCGGSEWPDASASAAIKYRTSPEALSDEYDDTSSEELAEAYCFYKGI